MGNQGCEMFSMNKRTCFVYLSTDFYVKTPWIFSLLEVSGGESKKCQLSAAPTAHYQPPLTASVGD